MPGRGFETRVGLKREPVVYTPTYPAVAAIQVDTLVPITEESVAESARLAYSTTRSTQGSVTHGDVVMQEASASFTADLYYQGFELLWALALGFQAKRIGGTVFPEQLAVGAYRHRFEIDPHLRAEPWTLGDGFLLGELTLGQHKVRRMTVAAYRGGVSVWEARSAMVSSLSLSGGPGQALSVSVEMAAHSVSNTSVINTTGVLDALSVPTAPRVLFHHAVFRLKAYSASVALGSGDVTTVQGCTLSIANQLQGDPSRRTGLYAEEPERQGACAITGTFTLPRYVADTLALAQRAGTSYMADWVFTGGAIGATGQNYALKLYFPRVHFDTVDIASSGPGRIPVQVSFTAREPETAAAGMPSVVRQGALILEATSGLATNPLL